jgi:hypothetical protein
MKQMCRIYPSSATQCQRACRFKIQQYKEPDDKICSNVKEDWKPECKERADPKSNLFQDLPPVKDDPQRKPTVKVLERMSDEDFEEMKWR